MARLKLEHVGLMVKNIGRSADFYHKVVGLQLKSVLPHPNGIIRLGFLGFNAQAETEIELIEGYNDQLPQEGKVHHIAFTVENIEEEFERIKSLDVSLKDTEITVLGNGAKYFFFYGPDSELIEFFQPVKK